MLQEGELNKAYIDKILEGKQVSERPFYLLSCGGPGSGKGLPAAILKRNNIDFALLDMDVMQGNPNFELNRKQKLGVHPEKMKNTIVEFGAVPDN